MQPSTKPPWNPSIFYPLAILCGVAAVGILAGINYRRLGKHNLRWPTISTSVLTFVAVIVGIRVTESEAEVVIFMPWLVNLLAAFVLVILSLLPTLFYYFSVYQLGFPPGNLDSGGFSGSLLRLIFLGAAFVSVGIFTSSITDNQVISFIGAVLISAFLYMGFEFI